MRTDYPVVLDACVLIPPVLCDLLLRLAEEPRLYLPRWSQEILDEVHRNQQEVLGWESTLADYWREQVTASFPEALVKGYGRLIGACNNHPKDRHVLAAAIGAACQTIVTENVRDFPKSVLSEWSIEAVKPGDYLTTLLGVQPAIVATKIDDMGLRRKRARGEILGLLHRTVPTFASSAADSLGVQIVHPGKGTSSI